MISNSLWSIDTDLLDEPTLKELRSKVINKDGENLCLKLADFKGTEMLSSEQFLLHLSEMKDIAIRIDNMLLMLQFDSEFQPIKSVSCTTNNY